MAVDVYEKNEIAKISQKEDSLLPSTYFAGKERNKIDLRGR